MTEITTTLTDSELVTVLKILTGYSATLMPDDPRAAWESERLESVITKLDHAYRTVTPAG